MNINKPIIGILATPFIDNNNQKKIFIKQRFINLIKKNNCIPYIIPYNLNKNKLTSILKNINGIIFPGSQIGNLYSSREIKNHFVKQKFLVNQIKKINKKRPFPILGICHGYENLILIELGLSPNKNNIKKTFKNVHTDNAYKNTLNFTKKTNKLKKLYNKSKKIIHNNKLGFYKKDTKNIKSFEIIAFGKDRLDNSFVEIIKHKTLPFYGFQAHPERNNTELLIPFFDDCKKSFKLHKSPKILKIKKLFKSKKQVNCRKYGLAKKTNKQKCFFYKI